MTTSETTTPSTTPTEGKSAGAKSAGSRPAGGYKPTGESKPASSSKPASGWILPIAVTLLSIAILYCSSFSSYWVDQRNDQYQLINLGYAVYGGGTMYLDVWENKPPGIAWINALGYFLTGSQIGAWILPGVIALICIIVMAWSMSGLLSPFSAWCTALLATVVISLRIYDTPSINPDFYSSMFELAAGSVWLLALYSQKPGGQKTFGILAGLLWAMSVNVKQTGIVGLVVVSTITAIFYWQDREKHRDWIATTINVWIGFFGVAVVISLILIVRNSFGEAFSAVFSFNQTLLDQGHVKGSLSSWVRVRAGLAPVSLVLWFGLLGVIASFSAGRAKRSSPILIYTFVAWWVLQIALALLGPSMTMRYWQSTFPPMLWLAAIGIYHLGETMRRTESATRGAFIITLLTVVVLLGRPMFDHFQQGLAAGYVSYSNADNERNTFVEMGKRLRELVPAGEKIYVLDYKSGVYVHAQRLQAVRFSYPQSQSQMEEIVTGLEAYQAFAILKPTKLAPEFTRFCDDTCTARIDKILENYEQKTTLNRFEVWTRRDANNTTDSDEKSDSDNSMDSNDAE